MNNFAKNLTVLAPYAPILTGLLQSLSEEPTVSGLDNWIYNAGYDTLGKLLGEMHPLYDGLEIVHTGQVCTGHNGFEEFVIDVINAVVDNFGRIGSDYDSERFADSARHTLAGTAD